VDTSSSGQVASLRLNVAHKAAMQVVQSAKFIAGEGIEGDRHATPRAERHDYQVLLMDEETLAALDLSAGQVRENVTTSGIELSSLAAGQRIALGDQTVLRISKPCAPCSRMEEIRPGLQQELEGRRGMLAFVVEGGAVEVGDAIRVL
jgi:MOSC domain-containing protein YiiM